MPRRPSPTDVVGTVDTTGIGSGPHSHAEGVSVIFDEEVERRTTGQIDLSKRTERLRAKGGAASVTKKNASQQVPGVHTPDVPLVDNDLPDTTGTDADNVLADGSPPVDTGITATTDTSSVHGHPDNVTIATSPSGTVTEATGATGEATEATEATGEATEATEATGEAAGEAQELSKFTKDELTSIASVNFGIEVASGDTKADIVAALTAAGAPEQYPIAAVPSV